MVSLTNHDKKEVVRDATKKLYRLGIWRTGASFKAYCEANGVNSEQLEQNQNLNALTMGFGATY